MASLRHHLRIVVVLWLVSQTAAASAWALVDCCAGHGDRHAASHGSHPAEPRPEPGPGEQSCHRPAAGDHAAARHDAEAATAGKAAGHGDACPMRGTDGQACPMHRSPQAAPASDAACRLTSPCGGPGVTLARIFFVQAVVPPPPAVPLPNGVTAVPASIDAVPVPFDIRPDARPPRRA